MLAEPEAKGFDLERLDRARRARARSAALGVGSAPPLAPHDPAPDAAAAPDLDPDDARRLDAELATFDR